MVTYSSTLQDAFALKILPNGGFYLDIGCSDGVSADSGSNSKLLEENGWNGIMLDNRENMINLAKSNRSCKNIFCCDVAQPGKLLEIFKLSNCPVVIDYISLDVDAASWPCLKNFPHAEYRFKFMTFEHDINLPNSINLERKRESTKLLHSLGYITLVDNVWHGDAPYEDYFIDPKHFDMNIFKNLLGQKDIKYDLAYKLLQ